MTDFCVMFTVGKAYILECSVVTCCKYVGFALPADTWQILIVGVVFFDGCSFGVSCLYRRSAHSQCVTELFCHVLSKFFS